jgi:hypothetical protein
LTDLSGTQSLAFQRLLPLGRETASVHSGVRITLPTLAQSALRSPPKGPGPVMCAGPQRSSPPRRYYAMERAFLSIITTVDLVVIR